MSLDMNPEIRAQWCAALRSGEYRQATGQLRRLNEDGEPDGGYRFCCLGVLTDLAIKSGALTGPWASEWEDPDADVENLSAEGELPDDIREWAALADPDPYITSSDTAAWHNDHGYTFAQIADLIDGGAS